MNIKGLMEQIETIVPLSNAFFDDKVGLLIGNEREEVTNLIVAHDLTLDLLDHCIDNNINCVIVYHPPIHKPLDFVRYDNPYTEVVARFLYNNISVLSLHTALDVAEGGNADTLADLFDLKEIKKFAYSNENFSAGRIGYIPSISPEDFLTFVEKKLNTKILRTNKYFSEMKSVERVALLPGSGTDFINEVIGEADVYLTGDISHHHFLTADIANLGLVQISHISSEIPGIDKFSTKLATLLNMNLSYYKPIHYG